MYVQCAGSFVEFLTYFTNNRPSLEFLLLFLRMCTHVIFQMCISNEPFTTLGTNMRLIVLMNSHMCLEISSFCE